MRYQRLRAPMKADELARTYAKPHDHRHWFDHTLRVDATLAIIDKMRARLPEPLTVADLSCGNGIIPAYFNADKYYLGDLAPGYEYTGPIEQTLRLVPNDVDVFVLCETLEHLDNPLDVLLSIRSKTDRILLSTPLDAWNDPNPEHYWAWDKGYVERVLWQAGFDPEQGLYSEVDTRELDPTFQYMWGIWGAR